MTFHTAPDYDAEFGEPLFPQPRDDSFGGTPAPLPSTPEESRETMLVATSGGLLQEFFAVVNPNTDERIQQGATGRYFISDGGAVRPATSAEVDRFVRGIEPDDATGGGGGGISISDLGPVSADLRRSELEEATRSAVTNEAIAVARMEQEAAIFEAGQSQDLERLRIQTEDANRQFQLDRDRLIEDQRVADNQIAIEEANLAFLQERFRVETEAGNRSAALATEQFITSTRARVEDQKITREGMADQERALNANFRMQTAVQNSQNELRVQELNEAKRQFNLQQRASIARDIATFQSRPGDIGKLAGFLTSLAGTQAGSLQDGQSFVTDRSLAPLDVMLGVQRELEAGGAAFSATPLTAEQVAVGNQDGGGSALIDEAAARANIGGDVTAGETPPPILNAAGEIQDAEALVPSDQLPDIPLPNVAITPAGTQVDANGDGVPEPAASSTGPVAPAAAPAAGPAVAPAPAPLTPDQTGIYLGNDELFAAGGQINEPADSTVFDPVTEERRAVEDLLGQESLDQVAAEQEAEQIRIRKRQQEILLAQAAEQIEDPDGFSLFQEPAPVVSGGERVEEFEEFGFAEGGVGFFNTPTTVNVAENGPEVIAAQPVSGGGGTAEESTATANASIQPGTQDFFNLASQLALDLSGFDRDLNPLQFAGPNIDPLLQERGAGLASARRGIDPEFFARRIARLTPQGTGPTRRALGRTA